MDFFVDIHCSDDQALQLVEARLFELPGFLGTVSNDDGSQRTYFETEHHRDAALHSLREIEGAKVHAGEISSTDWLEHYEQSLHALPIGERFIVAPDERLVETTGRMAIIIPQEQAFGTGSHATTALCLAAMEKLPITGRRGIDVGTGTGILAMGLAACGARRVFAFDNDDATLEVLGRNLRRNASISGPVLPFFGTIHAVRGTFDVMTVNILAEVIIELMPSLVSRLAVGGHIILSGVILPRRDDVMSAAKSQGLELVRTAEEGEWWCGVYRQPGR